MSVKTLPLRSNGHQISNEEEVDVFEFELEGMGPYCPHLFACGMCGDRPDMQVIDGVLTVKEPCHYADGITTKITLNVTSGRIIVTDDLRPIYDWRPGDEAFASYNSALGQHQAIKAMAEVGCAYGPVGNSCPGLYRTGEGSYLIASPECCDEDGNEINPTPPEETCMASICTDLWAYSIADLEHWKARGGDPGDIKSTTSIIDFPSGLYRFTHHTGEKGFDRDASGVVVFANIERIGPAL